MARDGQGRPGQAGRGAGSNRRRPGGEGRAGDDRVDEEAMGRLIETLVGATVAAAARIVGAVQAATGLQSKARPLTDLEAEILRRVYRGALDLAPIRIVEGRSGLFGLSGRPFTLGNRIYLKGFAPQ